ncbi:hypothetical protein HanPI659440_Chr05g0189171 [Helianthus annuus]|nr:hypothetical protein HanHA89_Chr05g0184451 [Helianthus annuus]KAJ0639094.1 hypothetical protein HanHA300_Chr00c0003g0677831 [Helianthus annuus]KAJ0746673.1 hypothetical protein HanOQP8_Chr05g0180671 [Helianthus annuus]KAJ0749752.1 hypothetical protein HanLR1_Chr05g0173821 [Helianthus annuus]KAJ0788222.1 hypothetical protein HanPI659440_Chr05g0189171 [Helianthus annuus]
MKPRFMALRAFGRSRVSTATPFGYTFPLTKSPASELAIAVKFRREIERSELRRRVLGKVE